MGVFHFKANPDNFNKPSKLLQYLYYFFSLALNTFLNFSSFGAITNAQ